MATNSKHPHPRASGTGRSGRSIKAGGGASKLDGRGAEAHPRLQGAPGGRSEERGSDERVCKPASPLADVNGLAKPRSEEALSSGEATPPGARPKRKASTGKRSRNERGQRTPTLPPESARAGRLCRDCGDDVLTYQVDGLWFARCTCAHSAAFLSPEEAAGHRRYPNA